MIFLPSHINHALQPLNVVYFGLFKTAFRTYRDIWMMDGNGEMVGKENLAQWVSIALKKALTPYNIRADFKDWHMALKLSSNSKEDRA